MRRMALLAFLPVLLIPGERFRTRAVPTRAELAEREYLRRLPLPDPLVRGRSLAYWRAAAKTGGVAFGGWAGHAEILDGHESVVVMIHEPGADRLADLFVALAADPDPGVRQVAARGMGGYYRPNENVTVGALVVLNRDANPAVRWEAARALLRFGWYVLGRAELDQVAGWIPVQPPEAENGFGVSPVRPAELAAVNPRSRPFPWPLVLDPSVEDADLAEVADFHGLYSIIARRTRVTDAGLAHFVGLGRLVVLDLEETRVTDAGLTHLVELPSLRAVYARGSGVTEAGVTRLQAARPDVRVWR